MLSHKIYYQLKPLIPRSLQITLRRMVIQRKRKLYEDVWPIDEKAGRPPDGWRGWPDEKKFALVLMHDVDTEKGHEKCLDLAQIDERMGFRSSFNFVPERYHVSSEVRRILVEKGFEVGVHGLKHDGKLFSSRKTFLEQAARINHYLKDWRSVGFVSPSMHRNLDWIHDLNVEYDASTFDTDPFEPQPEGVSSIFPFWESRDHGQKGYIELPYTLSQDHTLFVVMGEKSIDIWKQKLDWIVINGGMAMLITHPDYMSFNGKRPASGEYPAVYYTEFLEYIKQTYKDQFWNALPKDLARFWRERQSCKGKIAVDQKYEVTLIDPIKDPRWDAFVENHPFGWICHLSGWKKVLETSFPHMKGHCLALVGESNEIKAGLPLFEVKSWLTGKRLVSIPFATLCDPLVSNSDQLEKLLGAAKRLSKDLGTSYLEIRTTNAHCFMRDPQFAGNFDFKNHYLGLNFGIEELWKSLHRKAVRQEINRANRNNLAIKYGETEDDLKVFYGLYTQTRKRLGLPTHPFSFLKSLWKIFGRGKGMELYLAIHQDRPIAGHILFRFNGRVSAEFEGWDKRCHKLSPNHFLFWEEIKAAHQDGFKVYDFGRTSTTNVSLMEFKGHWGTRVMDLPIYYYPEREGTQKNDRDNALSYRLARYLCKISPEPIHPLIGRLIYKHLG
jgi:hypothetical protein